MKPLLLILSSLMTLNLFAQRLHTSDEKIKFTLLDTEYLDSADGAIHPDITTGFRPFAYTWGGPNDFMSTDSILQNLTPGIYYLKIEDALCGKFSDTFEIRSKSTLYETPDDIFVKSISPNPFIDKIRIQMESESAQEIDIRIFDNAGKLTFQKAIQLTEGMQTIELNDIAKAKGIYIIQICDRDKCQVSERLLKME